MENKNVQRICGMIGFARRAGEAVIGTELICRAMPKGKLKLVVVSSSSSENTKKKLETKSEFYGIQCIEADIDTERLGSILGKSGAVAAVGITKSDFAEEIKKASVQ